MLKAFKPIVTKDSVILLLGTMPSEKSILNQQYYGNPNNAFWKLMARVFNYSDLNTYKEKIHFIENHNLALWDVLAYCERSGSLDSSIKNPIANNFEVFFKLNPQIKHVFFTSKNAYNLYKKHVKKSYDLTYHVLPSCSGAYAVMKFEEKLEHWKLIKNIHEKLTKK